MKPSEITSSANSWWQTHEERLIRSIYNGDMVKRAKFPVSDGVTHGSL